MNRFSAVTGGLVMAGVRWAAACPVCFGANGGDSAVARGFFWGILLLLCLPLVLILGIGGRIYLAHRKQGAKPSV